MIKPYPALIDSATKKLAGFDLQTALKKEDKSIDTKFKNGEPVISDLLYKISIGLKSLVSTDLGWEAYVTFSFFAWNLTFYTTEVNNSIFRRQFEKNSKIIKKTMRLNKIKLSQQQIDLYLMLAYHLKLAYYKKHHSLLRDYRFIEDPEDRSMHKLQVATEIFNKAS
jgi:hypothetical protein